MLYSETTIRTIVKTIGFKIVTTLITAFFMGLGGAIKLHIILTLVYLLYEKLWIRINWGKIINQQNNQK